MSINLKFLTFFLIAILLITSYRKAIHAPNTLKQKDTVAKKAPAKNVSTTSLIRKGDIQAPRQDLSHTIGSLFALINTNNPGKTSNFLITENGIDSSNAKKYGFDSNWISKNSAKEVFLNQDQNQINNLVSRGVLPDITVLSNLKKNQLRQPLYELVKYISDNFPKVMLYFEEVSPKDGKPYKLYIADPCPGKTNWTMISQGRLDPQVNIPAYTNVLRKWNAKKN